MKMIAGRCLLASSNSREMRFSVSPSHMLTISLASTAKNEAFACDARTRAMVVFPVPGGPNSRIPRGTSTPRSASSSLLSIWRWRSCSFLRVSGLSTRSSHDAWVTVGRTLARRSSMAPTSPSGLMGCSAPCWIRPPAMDFRIASRAAPLTMVAMSAALMPSVRLTSSSILTSPTTGRPDSWASKMHRRAASSGKGIEMWRSKRPGRIAASSSVDLLLVAAITIRSGTSRADSNSRSNWFTTRVDSVSHDESSRRCAIESNSSKKRMQGLCFAAFANTSATCLLDSPAKPEMISETRTSMKLSPNSPATAFARKVLPTPGGPYSSTPFQSIR